MKLFFQICLLLAMLWACKRPAVQKDNSVLLEEKLNTVPFDTAFIQSQNVVIYNLFSPVEFTYLVAKDEAYFNSTFMNPLDNITRYSTSNQLAINLGVYGADLSYLMLFNQTQQALSYLSAIQRLSDALNIPRDFIDVEAMKAECNAGNPEKLHALAVESYENADRYLREAEREQSALLILLGGWIETLYIAGSMHKPYDAKWVSRLAMQEFSLHNLYHLLQEHKATLSSTQYLELLEKLKIVYDNCKLEFPEDQMEVDTVLERISLHAETEISLTPEQINEINEAAAALRNYAVNN